jgi:hypothetical protein
LENLVKICAVLLLGVLCASGCETKNPAASLSNLPEDAKDVKEVGNGWVTFSCDIEGRKRKFMLHLYNTYGRNTVGTITELKE